MVWRDMPLVAPEELSPIPGNRRTERLVGREQRIEPLRRGAARQRHREYVAGRHRLGDCAREDARGGSIDGVRIGRKSDLWRARGHTGVPASLASGRSPRVAKLLPDREKMVIGPDEQTSA